MKLKSRIALAASIAVVAALGCAGVAAATTGWAVQTTPIPSGATYSLLAGVACGSATTCMAVGDYNPSGGQSTALAESWNGTSWTLDSPANLPAGTTTSELSGVSCWSATACTAVGYYVLSSVRTALAESWTGGTSWTLQTPTTPAGFEFLNGVSCTSASSCTAVGYYEGTDATVTLAEGWNGTKWQVETTPNPSNADGFSGLSSVSCTSNGADCTAVGYYFTGANTTATLAERWNGKTWTLQSAKNMNGPYTQFAGVSCSSATACTAVGFYVPKSSNNVVTLAEAWNGSKWSVQPTVDLTHYNELTAVSCPAASNCTAVGWAEISTAGLPVIEHWNGSTWEVQSADYTPGATTSSLYGVSCRSATVCSAVGQATVSSVQEMMAEGY